MPLASVNASRSSPLTNPAPMVTVARSRSGWSGSATVTVPSTTAAASPSVKARAAPALTTGASLTGVTVTVLVTALLSSAPSLITKRMVRAPPLGVEPSELT